MTYMTYITDITDTLHFLRFQSMTRHDMTLLHILTYGSCAHGKGNDFTSHPDVWQLRAWEGEEDRGEKKAELCTFMLPEITNTYSSPYSSHLHVGLSLACSVASLSHPSVATCQLIMNYSMIALQTAS